jgi:hypothetical protein
MPVHTASTKPDLFGTMPLSTMLKELFMTTIGHIEALERRHQELDRKIQSEMQSSRVNDMMVASLKRKKLEVKDELYKLQTPAKQ